MYNVGLITFHASYNFGSVMQAWSTKEIVKSLGYNCEIINYRMKTQKDKYSLFPIHGGIKLIFRNLIQLPYIRKKYLSNKKYEKFINTKLPLTEECNTIYELSKLKKYNIYLAGSDQIWGYHIPEFDSAREDVRGIYYLNFAKGYKISYASSTGTATYEQLLPYKKFLTDFSEISVREKNAIEVIQRIVNKKVENVLDPTYLISHEQWVAYADNLEEVSKEPYILIYSLQGMKKAKKWKKIIENIQDIKFVTVVPFSPIVGKNVINKADAGPEEILKLFANAAYVFTDTFHGMSFSIHFRKSFVIYEDTEADFRKRNVLNLFKLSNRETNSIEKCLEIYKEKILYDEIEHIIRYEMDKSISYLTEALNGYTRWEKYYNEKNTI